MAEEQKPEGEEAPAEEATPEPESSKPEAAGGKTEATVEAEATPIEPEKEGPSLTAREIEKMNVPKLKEAALEYGGKIAGVHGMDKGQLVRSLKEINGIPLQEARGASKIDRQEVKQKIKVLRRERDGAIEDKDTVKLKRIRKRAKALRRKLVRYS